MKRLVYELRWDKAADGGWWLRKRRGEFVLLRQRKAEAEKDARFWCRALWEKYGTPVQLLIYTKAGKIGKGGRYEASYGCDSIRRRG